MERWKNCPIILFLQIFRGSACLCVAASAKAGRTGLSLKPIYREIMINDSKFLFLNNPGNKYFLIRFNVDYVNPTFKT